MRERTAAGVVHTRNRSTSATSNTTIILSFLIRTETILGLSFTFLGLTSLLSDGLYLTCSLLSCITLLVGGISPLVLNSGSGRVGVGFEIFGTRRLCGRLGTDGLGVRFETSELGVRFGTSGVEVRFGISGLGD